MAVQLGTPGQPGFDEPIALMMDCHRRIEKFLGILEHVAEHCGTGRLDEEAERAVRAALRYFREAAPNHTADEEHSLFPRLREIESAAVAALLSEADRLETQHREAEQMHRTVEAAFNSWIAQGSISPEAIDALRAQLRALKALYREHIAFEDHVLFPMAVRLLDEEEKSRIGKEMQSRRRPAAGQ